MDDPVLSRWKDLHVEDRYRERAYAYFGRLLRALRVVAEQDLIEIEANLEHYLTDDEFEDVLLADILIRGYPRQQPDAPEVWLVVEVSAVVDQSDVEQAKRRASLLQKARIRTVPAVAGESINTEAMQLVEANRVLLVQNEHKQHWEEALAKALLDF